MRSFIILCIIFLLLPYAYGMTENQQGNVGPSMHGHESAMEQVAGPSALTQDSIYVGLQQQVRSNSLTPVQIHFLGTFHPHGTFGYRVPIANTTVPHGLLHIAVILHNKDAVKGLLTLKAPLDMRWNCRTPLCFAAGLGDAKSIKYLLQQGANPRITDVFGNTPLHYACLSGNKKCISLLLNSAWYSWWGKKLGYAWQGYAIQKNKQGKQPLDLCHETHRSSVKNLFRQAGIEL